MIATGNDLAGCKHGGHDVAQFARNSPVELDVLVQQGFLV